MIDSKIIIYSKINDSNYQCHDDILPFFEKGL